MEGFGKRDLSYLKAGIRDFKQSGGGGGGEERDWVPLRTSALEASSYTAIAREWFQTSNLIKPRQIQSKESVAVRRGRLNTLKHIHFHNL